MPTRILITGGAGFVGSNLACSFRDRYPETRVIALDNLKRRGSELNLRRMQEAGVSFIHGDIRNPEDLTHVPPIDLLIECSAEPSVNAGYGDSPGYLLNTNIGGTINCLELARSRGADFLFLSSSRVYPIQALREIRLTETSTRFEPELGWESAGFSSKGISEAFTLHGSRSLYGATKLASELLITEYNTMYGLRTIVNRCGVLTGPWQMGKVDQGFVVLWVARHLLGGKLEYFGWGGTGKQVRDILHIEDLFNLLCLQLQNMDQHSGETYNVGGGLNCSVSLQELTQLCLNVTQREANVGSVMQSPSADIPYYVSDCTKIMSATGWRPEKTLKDIVRDIVEWIISHQSELLPILGQGAYR